MATTTTSDVGMDTTSRSGLIASDRVEGTPVRRPGGDKIGTIERLMIEKVSGRVAYAVMSIGGFIGVGEQQTTLPWSVLTYDTTLDAYVLDRSEEQLRGAPQHAAGGTRDPSFDRDWEEHVHRYFSAEPYWNEAAPRASQEARQPSRAAISGRPPGSRPA